MAFYRGQDGSFTVSATPVGQVVGWTLQTQQELLDADVMGISWKQYVGGLGSWTGTVTVRFDYSDTEQAALVNTLITATPAGGSTAVKFNVSSTKYFSGSVIIRDVQFQNQLNQLVGATINFTGTGNPSISWT